MPYRILHIADAHLDMAFTGVDARLGSRRREQLREAFERALQLGRDRMVDAVCIAGDLYEDGRSGHDRAAYLGRVLGALAPMRVFIAPGNHDPHSPSSLYRQISPPPENVVIFGRRRFSPALLADGITLWGFGHEHGIDRDPALAGFSCDGPGVHLLLFHGSDRDAMPPGKDAVAPFSAGEIERAGAQYAMVGHFHGLLQGARHAYPGSLEPHTFSQDGRHTASIVTIDAGSVSAEFIDVNHVRYIDISFDVSAYHDRAALSDALRAHLAAAGEGSGTAYCRVRLIGEAQRTLDVDVETLEADLDASFEGALLVEDFAAFDYDGIESEGRTVRAEFVRAMRASIESASEAQRPLLDRALRYGLLAFADRTIPT